MTNTETKLADALRELLDSHDHAVECDYADQRAADEREAAARVAARESLAAHDSARAQPASVADGFASWGDWLESLTDDELVTIFYHYPDAANRMKRLLAATPQPAKESDR